MLIVCPQCDKRYVITSTDVDAGGRIVRCLRCRAEWTAYPDPDEPEFPPQDVFAATGENDDGDAMPAEGQGEADPPLLHGIPEFDRQPGSGNKPAVADDIERRAARRSAKPAHRKRRLTLPLSLPGRRFAVAAMLMILAGAVVGRTAVVRIAPNTASLFALIGLPVNLRGLDFSDVKSSETRENGTVVLAVEGMIRNATHAALAVPRLHIALRDGKASDIYDWTAPAPRAMLGPDEAVSFRSRLASPPADANAVAVRFVVAQDDVAAMK